MGAPGLSACIITLNEAERIGDCLASLSFCNEIVVVDAHSSDATREIAARLGARVIERDWPGYRSQKQYATDAAAHAWVLSVDADERVTPGLRAEIEALRATGFAGARGWTIPRMTEYFGRFLRHGNAWPERQIRLYDRRAARGGRGSLQWLWCTARARARIRARSSGAAIASRSAAFASSASIHGRSL